ncbi:MAG: Crp/Fnr family transcriptional regulator [candidate division NC10 bacterium]|nr:Crp/Fnr family transcriptional regulator [candidate division NC10 bacterium]
MAADATAVRDAIRSVPFFAHLTEEELACVIALGRVVAYPKDMVLFHEGDVGEAFYIVVDGSIRISKQIPGVGEEAIYFVERGNWFGEMALFDAFPRSATAIAHQAALVLFLDRHSLLALFDSDPIIARKILWAFCRTLSLRLRETNDRITALFTIAGRF